MNRIQYSVEDEDEFNVLSFIDCYRICRFTLLSFVPDQIICFILSDLPSFTSAITESTGLYSPICDGCIVSYNCVPCVW